MTPVGCVLPYAGSSANDAVIKLHADGFLFCNGARYSKDAYSELYAVIGGIYGRETSTEFNVPDYRGLFMRGSDMGCGRDSDWNSRPNTPGTSDKVGSYQDDMYRSHNHFVGNVHYRSFCGANDSDKPIKNCRGDSYYTSSSGGSETRPKNIAVNYIICYSSYPVYDIISQYSFPFIMSPEYGFRSINTVIPPKQMANEEILRVAVRGDSSFKKISIYYKGGAAFHCGTNAGAEQSLELGAKEYIAKIQGIVKDTPTVQKEFSYISVETSDGRKIESPGISVAGMSFTLSYTGKKVIGLYGSENTNHICASLGAYYKDI